MGDTQTESTTTRYQHRQGLSYLALVGCLLACLWVGWSDFDLAIPQDIVRLRIRALIRGVIQLAVQFVIPGAILAYLVGEVVRHFRRRSCNGH